MIEMKDSGIEWIGDIPAHWEIKRLKSIFSECKDLSSTGEEDLLSVSEYYGVARRLDIKEDDEFDSRADSLEGYKICKKNDLVINIMLAWKRGLGFSDYDGIVSPAYAVYRGKNIIPHYYHYLLRTDRYIAEFKRNSKGIIDSRLRLYSDRFFNIKTIVPPLAEQQAIADYLDKKTAEIDKQITALEKKSDAYQRLKRSLISEVVTRGLNPTAELKDSGIEWIGKIPAHWEIRRLKDVSSFVNGYAFDSNDFETDDGIKVIRIGDIGQSVDFENCARAKTDSALLSGYKINDGDILLAMSGATTGKTCIVYNPQEAFINQRVGIIRSKMSKMIFYLLQTPYFLEFVNLYNTGSAQPNISSKDVGEFPIIVVPAEERQMLTDYLDKKTAEIDSNISAISSKVDAYKRLKQSLIDEVVTGKRRIEKA